MTWKKDVEEWFSADRVGSNWDRMYTQETERLDEHNFRRRRDFALQWVDKVVGANGRVLDLGCGAGAVLSGLRSAGRHCIGLDYSQDMLQFAKGRLHESGSAADGLIRGDAETLPFRDGCFDGVVCLGVISYLQNYDNLLHEITRVLKPGAPALITFRNLFNPLVSDPVVALSAGWKLITRGQQPGHAGFGRYLNPRDVRCRIEAAGLHCEQFVGIGLGPYRLAGRRLFNERGSIKVSEQLSRAMTGLRLDRFLAWQTDVAMFVGRKQKAPSGGAHVHNNG